MHSLRRAWILKVVPVVAFGTALTSCADNTLTEPHRLGAGSNPTYTKAPAPNFSPDTISITRTIDIAAAPGHSVYHHAQAHVYVSGAVGVKHGATRPEPMVDTTRGVDGLPVPLLSVSASSASLGAQGPIGPRWIHTHAYGDSGTAVIVSVGNGDAPASEMRFVQGTDTIMTILQTWNRGPYTWDLVRRETIAPNQGFHEIIDVHHSGIVPGRGHAPPAMGPMIVGAMASNGRNSIGFFNQGSASPMDLDPCEGDNYEDPPACESEHQDANDAAEDVLAAIAAATIACASTAVTGPVGAIACGVATGAVIYLTNRSTRKTQAWVDCVNKYHSACGCWAETVIGPVVGPRNLLGTNGTPPRSGGRRTDACTDFAPDPEDDTGDSGGTSGGSDDGTETCYWLVEWDEYGNIIEADLLYCTEDAE